MRHQARIGGAAHAAHAERFDDEALGVGIVAAVSIVGTDGPGPHLGSRPIVERQRGQHRRVRLLRQERLGRRQRPLTERNGLDGVARGEVAVPEGFERHVDRVGARVGAGRVAQPHAHKAEAARAVESLGVGEIRMLLRTQSGKGRRERRFVRRDRVRCPRRRLEQPLAEQKRSKFALVEQIDIGPEERVESVGEIAVDVVEVAAVVIEKIVRRRLPFEVNIEPGELLAEDLRAADIKGAAGLGLAAEQRQRFARLEHRLVVLHDQLAHAAHVDSELDPVDGEPVEHLVKPRIALHQAAQRRTCAGEAFPVQSRIHRNDRRRDRPDRDREQQRGHAEPAVRQQRGVEAVGREPAVGARERDFQAAGDSLRDDRICPDAGPQVRTQHDPAIALDHLEDRRGHDEAELRLRHEPLADVKAELAAAEGVAAGCFACAEFPCHEETLVVMPIGLDDEPPQVVDARPIHDDLVLCRIHERST